MSSKKTNKFQRQQQVKQVSSKLNISSQLAKELLILADGDIDLVVKSSETSVNVAECKATIINGRFEKGESNGQIVEENKS